MKYIHNTLKVPCEKSIMVSFTCSKIKSIYVYLAQSRFAVKLLCCIVLPGSV